ncbi:MAG: fused MFS/spermidine synthase [Candidatus Andersenbacteria bacterium]
MRFIRLVAFTSGLVVLGIEITSFRIVAPYFGNSIFVTSNILGVILAGLAVGYWSGGWLADKLRAARPLFLLMLLTACVCALIPFVAPSLLSFLRDHISTVDWRLIVFSLLGCFVLFFIPFVLLGMVSPWLVHLGTDQHQHRGKAAGRIYAWSTIGSLLGTFLPTLLLVPLIGTKKTILSFAALLALLSVVGLARSGAKRVLGPGLVALVLAGAGLLVSPTLSRGADEVVAERESRLEYLRVVRDHDQQVHLEQDEGLGIHSVYDPHVITTGLVFDWLAASPELRPTTARARTDLSVGIVGLAGGTVAREVEALYGPKSVKPHQLTQAGAELDPATLDLARQYFGLGELQTLTSTPADGRVWLNAQSGPFDVLVVDAFRQLYIPPHLSTQEFFELAKSKLAADGILAVNLNVVGENSHVQQTLATTIASVFPNVLALPVPSSYNVVLYASSAPLVKPDPTQAPIELRSAVESIATLATPVLPEPGLAPATDDRPLVESWYDLMVGQAFVQ